MVKKQIDSKQSQQIVDRTSKKLRKHTLTKEMLQNTEIRLTESQNNLYKGIRNNIFTIVQGPSGTGKTFITCYTALSLLADKKIDRIIITKPIVESGENLGSLPGLIEDKINPYEQSYYTNFCKIISKEKVDYLYSTGEIQFEPLAYMRGSTYDHCVMLLDECQNATIKQLMLWITRMGKDSKAIMMGDITQYDLKRKDTGYNDFINMINDMDDVYQHKFSNNDIVRNKFLIEVANRYDMYRLTHDM